MINANKYKTGIYLLPNLLTTGNLFAAFYSIVSSLEGDYGTAAIFVFISGFLDILDGRIARLTNTQTYFGAQYDSLSDMVASGVAPALLIYSWNLKHLGKLGWLVAFLYTAAVALRLARFNTQLDSADKRYFQGLPCPLAAVLMASLVWLAYLNHWEHISIALLTAIVMVLAAVLMVSNVRYYSFKEIDFKGKVSFVYILCIVVLFVAVAAHPSVVVFTAAMIYILSGPLQTLIALHRVRKQRRQTIDLRRQKHKERKAHKK